MILGDGKHLQGDAKYTKIKYLQPNLSDIDFDLGPHQNFFKHVWPDVTGTAEILDKYLRNP
jgi:hypothetical protein